MRRRAPEAWPRRAGGDCAGRPRRAARRGSRRAPAAGRARPARRRRRRRSRHRRSGSSRSITRAPAAASDLRSSACAHTAPNMPVLAPITAAGLLRSAARRERPRGPVDGVLQHAGNRVVVLGRGEQQRVGRFDRLAPSLDRRSQAPARRPRRTAGSPSGRRTRTNSASGGSSCCRRPQQALVVRVTAQRAGDAENSHRRSPTRRPGRARARPSA